MSTVISEPLSKKAADKRRRILGAAADLIVESGYAATSLDAICERAGCSKSSIYEFFGNKEGLLATLSEDIAQELSRALHTFHLQEVDVGQTLRRYARLAMKLILTERHIAIVRALISVAWKHPELGADYYAVGARTAEAALQQYIETLVGHGSLVVADPQWAASEFQAMLLWDRFLAQTVGAKPPPTEQEIGIHADRAVNTFLARYQRAERDA